MAGGITITATYGKKLFNILTNGIIKDKMVTYVLTGLEEQRLVNKWLKKNIKDYKDIFIERKYSASIIPGTYYYFYKKHFITINTILKEDEKSKEKATASINIIGNNCRKLLHNILKEDNSNDIYCCNIVNEYDRYYTDVKYRSLNSVFSLQKKEVINHIEEWINSKETYDELGIIYKDGVLLYGKPGTGKTSFIRALACKYGFNIIQVDLSNDPLKKLDVFFNQGLTKNNDKKDQKFIVFMEEVDYPLKDEKIKLQVENKITQILDSVNSLNNCYFIFTTNDVSVIPEKWLRFGRLSKKIELTYLNRPYAEKICKSFNLSLEELNITEEEIQPAELSKEIMIKIKERRNKK